jgi:hypothetical protein
MCLEIQSLSLELASLIYYAPKCKVRKPQKLEVKVLPVHKRRSYLNTFNYIIDEFHRFWVGCFMIYLLIPIFLTP